MVFGSSLALFGLVVDLDGFRRAILSRFVKQTPLPRPFVALLRILTSLDTKFGRIYVVIARSIRGQLAWQLQCALRITIA
jgi:hypothetical protein